MTQNRNGRGAAIRINQPAAIVPIGCANELPTIVIIDCNKRQFAHLKTTGRAFVSMHSRGAMPVWEK